MAARLLAAHTTCNIDLLCKLVSKQQIAGLHDNTGELRSPMIKTAVQLVAQSQICCEEESEKIKDDMRRLKNQAQTFVNAQNRQLFRFLIVTFAGSEQ
jgi:superfamily I DNA and/or RNA helicase